MQRLIDTVLTLAVLGAMAVLWLPRDMLSKGLELFEAGRVFAQSTVGPRYEAQQPGAPAGAPLWVSDNQPTQPAAVVSDATPTFAPPPTSVPTAQAPAYGGTTAYTPPLFDAPSVPRRTVGGQPFHSSMPRMSSQAPQEEVHIPPTVPMTSNAAGPVEPVQRTLTPPPGYTGPRPQTVNMQMQAAEPYAPVDSTPIALSRTKVMARIGDEIVMASDVLGVVDRVLAENNADKMSPQQLEQIREQLVRQRLMSLIDTKLAIADMKRKIPAENLDGLWSNILAQYDKSAMKTTMEKLGVDNLIDFDAKLRETGTTLEAERRSFGEDLAAKQWVRQQIKVDEEITHDQMLRYYYDHAADFERQARVRWECISTHFENHSTQTAAYQVLAQAGNKVIDGQPFAEVAREVSNGSTAEDGGQFDWTNQGSLASETINQALFSLPVGSLSPILKDRRGFHIVRVIEREPAGRVPFTEAQVEIKQKLREESVRRQAEQYVAQLKKDTKVWTIFDEPGATVANLFPPYGSFR